MKKTFKQLQEIDEVVGGLYLKDENLRGSKFGYAYKRFSEKNYVPAIKEMNEEILTVRIDDALEDQKTKEIISDQANFRGFKYSKEGLKSVIKKEKDIRDSWDEKEIEITPHISTLIPEMTDDEKEILTGTLI